MQSWGLNVSQREKMHIDLEKEYILILSADDNRPAMLATTKND